MGYKSEADAREWLGLPQQSASAAAARAIEPLCILWCMPGLTGGGWNHALTLLRK